MRKLLSTACALALLVGASAPSIAGPGPGNNSPWNPVWSLPNDSPKYTYSLTYLGLVAASSATDVWQICGSSKVTVRVTRVSISGRATAAANMDVALIERSAANTGGTIESGAPFSSAAIPGWAYDPNDPTGNATVTAWTANPTLGTAIGTVAGGQVPLGNLTTGLGSVPVNFDFGNRPDKAIVLRGAASCLSVNLNAATYSGNLLDITTEWTEE